MRSKLLLLLLFFFSLVQNSTAQISGQVKDQSGSKISGATVILYQAGTNKMVKTAITDNEGKYEIGGVNTGDYYLSVSHSKFDKQAGKVFSYKDGEKLETVPVTMAPKVGNLEAVTVTGSYKKPMIEVTADKTIFNVENSINATGSNAFELLQKSPGVVTDKDDNITMKGKNGVRIYIDGRLTQLDGADLAAYLKSINSSDLESIEMIANPSARYDASGNAGIINLRLKKNRKMGFNGTASAGLNMGRNPKVNSGLSVNYRNKRTNLFSNYSLNRSINESNFYLNRKQNDSLYDQVNRQRNESWVHNIKAGADFFVSKTQTLGFIVTANLNNNESITHTRTPISSVQTGQLGQILYASNTIPGKTSNVNMNLNYRYSDSTGHEFNFDADYGQFRSRKTSYQPNSYFAPYPEIFLYAKNYRNATPNDVHIYTAKFDYESPLWKGKLGVGAKISKVTTSNSFDFYNIIDDQDIMDLGRSNSFKYDENINAGYINYYRGINKKMNLQAGVRVENTISNGVLTRADGLIQADNMVQRNYTDLFPSAALTYNHSKNHSFNFTYSRRIDRPNYQDLNPFENKLDELTYQKGNAFLRPQYTNSVQLTHTFKYRYITSLGYSYIRDFSAQIIDTTEKSRSFITKRNLASQKIVNLNFSLPFQITKWWSCFININTFHSRYRADFGPGKVVNLNVTSGSISGQQSFTLGGGYTGEISGFFNAPAVWAGTFRSRSMGGMDLGLQKKIFNDRATFKVSYTDLLHTMRWKGESNYSGANIIAHGNWESQQLRFNLTYRFGNNQVKSARQRQTSSEEEKKRTTESNGVFGN